MSPRLLPTTGALAVLLAATTATISPACAQSSAGPERRVDSRSGPLIVRTVAGGLVHPWGLAVLPDGRMLVTERPGRLRMVARDGMLSPPLKGVPEVFAQGQGGLHDVALDPGFAQNRVVYITYAEPGDGGAGAAVARARLADGALEDLTVIFRQLPKVSGGNHFGSRIAFRRDGTLFVTLGERFKFDPAQDLGTHLGKVVRIRPDGSAPDDNPFVNRKGARPEIWSYGHRNPLGGVIHPETGALWTTEMGPRGGDELNIPQAGKNYGWPLVSWGSHYDGKPIPEPTTRPDLADAIRHWTPVISPSGMTFYTGDRIPGWRGSLLISGLSSRGLVRLTLDGDKVTGEERILLGTRIRNVRQGVDGDVLATTDEPDGRILRLTPAE
ncbi:PQQ-dependent sugar dehydrogenase [Rhodoplanes sp. TEM]|uniref:PQQ-dependent sugar dehydrogenase n=1 Tax=Rhodoplanes tepidamans TaxID=200616 RepID=A0ABT5J4V4_RHOTP|nr:MULTISPECIES: PQQ-dependent sugar dehydrogenase [Rhodoplanes]MDC7784646.1 PQQ-dependent sugar dehydrogenase [Rhodoplanes tepidamans]MDC7982113.1 PQQ-dependent sugar dehydrogenase [Rhodoplanes sp. TEM]MDQ0356114.1 glucose/arabinose dehydrogenase [Rhodoplanes tepidamans]